MGATNQEVDLCPCTKHGSSTILANRGGGKKMGARLFENSVFLNKTVGAVKNVSNTIKTTTQQAATQVIFVNIRKNSYHYSIQFPIIDF